MQRSAQSSQTEELRDLEERLAEKEAVSRHFVIHYRLWLFWLVD